MENGEMRNENIKKITEKLLDKIGITDAVVEVSGQEGVFKINIQTEDSGLLIGYHGETLHALQIILGMMVNQGRKEWKRILVDVGDYRIQRDEALRRIAKRAVERVRESGEPQELSSMPAYERRKIHVMLSGEEGIKTESKGEGRDRRVVVSSS